MSNLGTLWFGADIDLTQLKNKINQGNQSILDALKINYDPASYTQMVSKLRQELGKETFDIKVSTNAQQVRQQLSNTINSIANTSNNSIDFSSLKGVKALTKEIIDQRDAILDNKKALQFYKEEWGRAITQFGRRSSQAMSAYNVYDKARNDLRKANWELQEMNSTRRRASLAQGVLNEQMKEAQKVARQWNSDHMRLNATLAGGIHVSTQLGSALSTLFAVDAARQFLGQVIEIGGQLEKQRISIGAILGDTVKANHLFEQIKGLALKSPFGVVELDQYTKQLSAYGFKYNELFDMTKRLADISAGAGTDIGRLTLALGHVRSATYLTGITLRQFSMNNIPMLKMLADYYTELEGKIVSTAEVQQRISKRQVSYEDVIEQIRRLTDEGGMFYNMQEKISESLAAKFKNLKDAIDIMYGEMAEGSVGDMLKGLASILLETTRHWKEIASVMAVAGIAFLYNKTRIGLTTATMQGNTAATIKQIMATKQLEANNLRAAASYRELTMVEQGKIASAGRLTAQDITLAVATNQLTKDDVLNAIALKKVHAAEAQALVTTGLLTQAEVDAALATNAWSARLSVLGAKLKNAFAGVGFGTFATIGAMVGMELYSAYSTWVDRIDDKSREMQDLIKSRIIDLEKQQKINEVSGVPKDSAEMKARIEDMRQVLANSEEYTKTLDEQLKATSSINTQYEILSNAIDNAVKKSSNMLGLQEDIAEMIKYSSGDFMSTDFGENLRWFFNDDITKNMSQTLDAYKDLRNVIDGAWEYRDAIKGIIEEMEKSGEISEDFAEQLRDMPFEEQIQKLATSVYWDKIVENVLSKQAGFEKFANNIKQASQSVADKWDEIATDDIPRMLKKEAERRGISERNLNKWCLENIDDFRMMLDGIANQLDIKEPAIRKRLKSLFLSYVRFGAMASSGDGTVSAEQYQKAYMDALNTIKATDEVAKRLLDEDPLANITNGDGGGGSNNGGANGSDKMAKELRERIKLIKDAYSWYKKYKDELKWSPEDAFGEIKKKYGDTLGMLGIKWDDEKKGITEYRDSLNNLLKKAEELYKDKGHKNSYMMDVIKEIKDALQQTDFDEKKEEMVRFTSEVKLAFKNLSKQWETYKKIVDDTGNRDLAARISGFSSKTKADAMKNVISSMALEGDIDFSRVLVMNDDLIKEYVSGLGLVGNKAQGVTKALIEWRDAQTDLINDARLYYGQMISEAAGLKTEIDKINEKYDEQIRKLQNLKALKPENPGFIGSKEYEKSVNQSELSRKLEISELFVDNLDFGQLFELLGNTAIETAKDIKTEIFKLISGAEAKNLSSKELERFTKLLNNLNNVGVRKTGLFSKESWTTLSNSTSNFQNTIGLLIKEMKKYITAQKDEEEALKRFKTSTDSAVKAQALKDVEDAKNRKKEASVKIAQYKKNAKTQGQQLSEAQRRIIEGAEAMTDSFRQVFAGNMHDLTLGILNIIGMIKGGKEGQAGGAAQSIGEALGALGVESGNVYGAIIGAILQILDMLKDDAVGFFRELLDNVFDAVQGLLDDIFSGELIGTIVGEVVAGIGKIFESVGNLIKNIFDGSFFTGIWDGITSAFNDDDEKQEKIENSKKQVEILQNLYNLLDKELERNLGGIYNTKASQKDLDKIREYQEKEKKIEDAGNNMHIWPLLRSYLDSDTKQAMKDAVDSESYYDTKLAELYLQRDELKHQLSLEEGKKNSDSEQIEDYKQQIADMEDQIKYFAEDMAKSIWDIDIHSWAEQLGDALFDAWQKGEDGAEAFRNKSREIIADLAKNIATKKLIEAAMEPVLQTITSEMKRTNGLFDESSTERIANSMAVVGETLPNAFNTFMDSLDAGMQRSGLGSLKETDESSSLGSGIKSITENTADLLAGYINAIRADVSVDRNMIAVHFPQFLNALTSCSTLAQTQVTLQTQIASNTLRNADAADKIYDIMHKIDIGATKIKMA